MPDALSSASAHYTFRIGEIVRAITSRNGTHSTDEAVRLPEGLRQTRSQILNTFQPILDWANEFRHGGLDRAGAAPQISERDIGRMLETIDKVHGVSQETRNALNAIRSELEQLRDLAKNGLSHAHIPAAQAQQILEERSHGGAGRESLRHPLNRDGTARTVEAIFNEHPSLVREAARITLDAPPASNGSSRVTAHTPEFLRRAAAFAAATGQTLEAILGRASTAAVRILGPEAAVASAVLGTGNHYSEAGNRIEAAITAHPELQLTPEAIAAYRGLFISARTEQGLTMGMSQGVGLGQFIAWANRYGIPPEMRQALNPTSIELGRDGRPIGPLASLTLPHGLEYDQSAPQHDPATGSANIANRLQMPTGHALG